MGALPILVLNNQMLSPRLGYFFDQRWIDPFESLVSILWKFARANDIAGHVLAASLCADGVDPYEGIPPLREMVKWRWLRREYRIPMRAIRESMVASSRAHTLHPDLRYCRRCLSRGYHATIQQCVGVPRCPIHDAPLSSACRICGFQIPLRLNALLLDSPFSCPRCRTSLAVNRPPVVRHESMRMGELVKITRKRLEMHLS
jgi:hypothetical protein